MINICLFFNLSIGAIAELQMILLYLYSNHAMYNLASSVTHSSWVQCDLFNMYVYQLTLALISNSSEAQTYGLWNQINYICLKDSVNRAGTWPIYQYWEQEQEMLCSDCFSIELH